MWWKMRDITRVRGFVIQGVDINNKETWDVSEHNNCIWFCHLQYYLLYNEILFFIRGYRYYWLNYVKTLCAFVLIILFLYS